ncbi:hypothetical protein M3Y95_00700300 [Aphelenchoides besseyi]|nr:hypothetical protein M3Y95_00700300 [Aphelenchoides besseyi]
MILFEGLVERSYKIPWLPQLPTVPTESPLRLVPQNANEKYDICNSQQPCVNDGRCTQEGNSYFCDCRPQYYADERACTSNLCENNSTCYTVETNLLQQTNGSGVEPVISRSEYRCWCKRGFYGQYCDYTESMRKCAEDICRHHGLVEYTNEDNRLTCSCRCEPFYSGENCEIVSPCRDHICVNGGICQLNSTGNPHCECPTTVQLSPNVKVTGSAHCEDVWFPDEIREEEECRPCAKNFTEFVSCLTKNGIEETQLSTWWSTCDEELAECFSKNLTEANCLNNGTCAVVIESLPTNDVDLPRKLFSLPHCDCPSEYEGSFCERRVFDPCTNLTVDEQCLHGNCSFNAADRTMQCICENGYYGPQCEFERPCTSYDCGDALCIELRHEDTSEEYPVCVCNSNQDVDNTTHRCSNSHYAACSDEFGSPRCKNDAYCYPCAFDETESPPVSTCSSDDTTRGFRCVCTPGYALPFCDRLLGPCDENRCKNGAKCNALPNDTLEYKCDCLKGYVGEYCETTLSACDRLGDLCVHGKCLNDQNLRRGFSCECDDSHVGINCNSTRTQSISRYIEKHFVWCYPLILFVILITTLVIALLLKEFYWKDSSETIVSGAAQ